MKFVSYFKAALYMRLSKDDGTEESSSITTQRKMLRNYAAENGYSVYDEYVDDGFSGTNFHRPAFMRMIADIEAKKVNMVITKDLSRLGRDYITAGQYTEIFFPSKGVRYIAINDGYDSDSPYNDIAPFKNVINEMYARDASKKIRSAFTARMQDGAYVAAFAPYGYQKDPENKHHLIIDERSGMVIQDIFRMAVDGRSPTDIARNLNMRQIPSPAVYRCDNHPELEINNYSKRREWTSSTITKILNNIVYCGHTAQGKTSKVSLKSNITVSIPREDWIVVHNTHEPLVDQETFDIVRRRAKSRTCEKKGEFFNLFSGIARCADCGRRMSSTGTRKKGSPANLTCGGYKLYGSGECSNHFIDYNVLYDIVLSSLKEQLSMTHGEKESILYDAHRQQKADLHRQTPTKELNSCRKRLCELERIIEKLYEDNASSKLSDARMEKLLFKYEKEVGTLEKYIAEFEKSSDTPAESINPSGDRLAQLLSDITEVTELTPKLLFKLIDHIDISQGHYEKGEHGKIKHQTVSIFYRFQTEATVREYVI